MPGVVLPGFKTIFAEVKVIAVPALESGAVDGEHLASITSKDNTAPASIRTEKTETRLQNIANSVALCFLYVILQQ